VTTTSSIDKHALPHVDGGDKATPSYRSGESIMTSPLGERVDTTTSPLGGGDVSALEEISSKSLLDFGEVTNLIA